MKMILFPLLLSLACTTLAQTPRLVVPVGHTDEVTAVAFATIAGNQFVLTGSGDNTAKLWNLNGKEIQTFKGHNAPVRAVAFSPKDNYILTGSDDATAKLWNLDGTLIRTFKAEGVEEQSEYTSMDINSAIAVRSVAFSPDGRYVLTCMGSGAAYLWNMAGKEVRKFLPEKKVNLVGGTDQAAFRTSVSLLPDGEHILVKNYQGTTLWSLDGKQVPTDLSCDKTTKPEIAAFSSVGESSVAICKGALRLVVNRNEVNTAAIHAAGVTTLAFSPDGRYFLVGGADSAGVWDLTGQQIHTFCGSMANMHSAAFSPDSKSILTICGGKAKLWALKRGHLIQSFEGHSGAINAAAFSPDGKNLFIGSGNGTVKKWDLGGKDVRVIGGKPGEDQPVAVSPDSKIVLTACQDSIKWWDLDGRELNSWKADADFISFANDGNNILTVARETGQLWDLAGNNIKTFTTDKLDIRSLKFSQKGRFALSKAGDTQVKIWDLNGKFIRSFPTHEFNAIAANSNAPQQSLVFSPNWQYAVPFRSVYGFNNNDGKLWQLGNPENRPVNLRNGGTYLTAFAPDGKTFLTVSKKSTLKIWDLSGKEKKSFVTHPCFVTGAFFSPNGQFILTSGLEDHSVKLWDASTGQELANLVSIDSTDWVVTTPAGLFDASPGAMKLMHYVAGLEVIELEQLKERYYEPFLLAKLMGFAAGGLRPVDTLNKVALYPAITKASIDGDRLRVQLAVRNGGIGRVALFLGDDIELEPNINPAFKPEFEVDLGRYAGHFFPDSLNRLSLRAYSREGWLKGPAWPLEYRPAGVSARGNNAPTPLNPRTRNDTDLEQIHLYALVVGTSTFRGAQLNLKYPDKDAAAFAEALRLVGKPLFGKNIEIKLLTTSAEPWPRKAEIARAFQNIAAKAGPADILLVYLSGHGITYPPASEKGQFYYLTTDILGDKLDDPATLQAQAIGQDTLQSWIRQVHARKRILILDACNSGRVVEVLGSGEKALNSDQRRALEQMKDRSGMFVIAGSAADKSSFEAGAYGHGLLTYSLLNNMPIVAAANKDLVSVDKLFGNVREEVPRLARDIGKEQEPELIGGESFGIGIVNDTVHIAVPKPLPVFVRVNFIDSQKSKDLARLSAAANACLEQRAGEREAPLAFWNVDDFAGDYYYIGGQYRQAGGAISGTAKLFRKDEELATFPFSGAAGAVDKLAEKIVEQAFEVLDRLK